jgi:hypothetical protein
MGQGNSILKFELAFASSLPAATYNVLFTAFRRSGPVTFAYGGWREKPEGNR